MDKTHSEGYRLDQALIIVDFLQLSSSVLISGRLFTGASRHTVLQASVSIPTRPLFAYHLHLSSVMEFRYPDLQIKNLLEKEVTLLKIHALDQPYISWRCPSPTCRSELLCFSIPPRQGIHFTHQACVNHY